jgi:hypothetical protein
MGTLSRIQSRIKGARSLHDAVEYRNKVCDVYKTSREKMKFFSIHNPLHTRLEHVIFTKIIQVSRIKYGNLFHHNFRSSVGCKIQEKFSTNFRTTTQKASKTAYIHPPPFKVTPKSSLREGVGQMFKN